MRLLLMRHAKSAWEADTDDHGRPLNRRGTGAARTMGHLLTAIGEVPDLVVTSSAVRAHTTALLAAEAGGWEANVHVESDLYLPDVDTVLDVVGRVGRGVGRVMLVGHEPAWGAVVARLTGGTVAMRTGTVAIVEEGELVALLQPRHFEDLV
jgi:phosphohistidine phosphatase